MPNVFAVTTALAATAPAATTLPNGIAGRTLAIEVHFLALDLLAYVEGRDDLLAAQGRNVAHALQCWAAMLDKLEGSRSASGVRQPS
jgi:hypothetical protein